MQGDAPGGDPGPVAAASRRPMSMDGDAGSLFSGAAGLLRTLALYVVTALAEIAGCWLPWRWLKHGDPAWLLLPAAASLAAFVGLLTLHPQAAGRVYAAYGGVYVATAIGWLWAVDGVRPTRWDLLGATVALAGMAIIVLAPRTR